MLMDKCTKNEQMYKRNYTNFRRNLVMMVLYLPVKFEFDWTKNEKLDRHTDGHWSHQSNRRVGYTQSA